MKSKSAEAVADALNDLAMCGGEISYRAEDICELDVSPPMRRPLVAAARLACRLVNRLGEIRRFMGLPERPDPSYRHVPPGGAAPKDA